MISPTYVTSSQLHLRAVSLTSVSKQSCSSTFSGTSLLKCDTIADDIQTCQDAGKAVTLSLGGATGSVGFSSDSEAEEFGDTIWNMFLGGSSDTRPFGDVVLDG